MAWPCSVGKTTGCSWKNRRMTLRDKEGEFESRPRPPAFAKATAGKPAYYHRGSLTTAAFFYIPDF